MPMPRLSNQETSQRSKILNELRERPLELFRGLSVDDPALDADPSDVAVKAYVDFHGRGASCNRLMYGGGEIDSTDSSMKTTGRKS
jgi:hypothetical protein